jgi:predicted permease
MSGVWRDIRYALRGLRRNPGFTAIVVLSLGLGIGLNTAVFSFVDAVLLHPFPYSQPERLVFIWGTKNFDVRRGMSGATLERWQEQSHTFEKIAPFQLNLFPMALGSDETDTIQAAYVGTDTFSILGVRPFLGEMFSIAQEEPGGEKAVILSYGLWQSRFGGDKSIVGDSVRVNGDLYTIKGIMPRGFFFPDQNAQLWIPLMRHGVYYGQVHGLGRLRPGVGIAEAQAELDSLAQNEAKENRQDASQAGAGVFPIYQVVVGKYEVALWTLLGAVSLLVLLACANVSNLLLARGIGREKELAVRVALGAGRGEILRQLLMESLVLALFAGAAGLLVGYWSIRALQGFRLADITGFDHASINYRVLFFSLGLSLLAGLVSGIAPAWKASRRNLQTAIQQGSAGTSSRKHGQLRDLLVSVEAAFALVLLVGAGLLVNSFVRLVHTSWGFDADHLLVVETNIPKAVRANAELLKETTENVLHQLQGMPGNQSEAMALGIPIHYGYKSVPLLVDGKQAGRDNGPAMCAVTHGYFQTMGIPILRGREFTIRDDASAPKVVILSHSLAERLWPGQNPVGKNFSILRLKQDLMEKLMSQPASPALEAILQQPGSWEPDGGPLDVVGVAGDVRMFGLGEESPETLYVDYRQHKPGSFFIADLKFLIRTSGNPTSAAAGAKEVIRSVLPDASFREIFAMRDMVSQSIGGRGSNKLLLIISILFGSLSLLLAVAGIYGVVSHSASQRTREIGIRIALGAEPHDIARLLTLQGLRPVIWGVALGLVGSWAVTRFFKSLVFGITSTDPATFVIVSILLILVALGTCLVPAIKAMRTNPIEALRYE